MSVEYNNSAFLMHTIKIQSECFLKNYSMLIFFNKLLLFSCIFSVQNNFDVSHLPNVPQ